MGWSTYYGLGAGFDESVVKDVAATLAKTGLQAAGYDIIWFDWGWASGHRDDSGNILLSQHQWPSGLRTVIAGLHDKGFRVGAYADAGASGGSGSGLGLLGHYDQDAHLLADLGFDAIKLDFVGAGEAGLNPRTLYPQFAAAMHTVKPDMIISCCNFWRPGEIDGHHPPLEWSCFENYHWAPAISHSWRTDTDIGTHGVYYANVLRNFDSNLKQLPVTGPHHWADPDNLVPERGMSNLHFRSQMSLWAISGAPLILGADPRKLSPYSLDTLKNPKVIKVDQDTTAHAYKVKPRIFPLFCRLHGQVYVKPLVNGALAFVALNRSRLPVSMCISRRQLGLPRGYYWIADLWSNLERGFSKHISLTVPGNSARMFLVWK